MTSSSTRKSAGIGLALAAVICAAFLLRAAPARAALTNCTGLPTGVTETEVNASWIRLQLEIPGITPVCEEASTDNSGTPPRRIPVVQDMGAYIAGLYKYLVSVIGIIAAVMVFYGGLKWLTAGGNASRVKDAKETVFSALIAIVIAFGSYTLLFIINPKLVEMRPPALKVADTIFQQHDAGCLTQKICFSGTSVGKVCKQDSDCTPGNNESGACQGMVDVPAGTKLLCGTRYNYKKMNNQSVASSDTCIGQGCIGDYTCTLGTLGTGISLKNFSPTNPSGIGIVFTPDKKGSDYICTTPAEACRGVRWRDTSTSACSSYSIPGVGMCRYYDAHWSDPRYRDSCYFNPILKCPDTWTRVACTPGCQTNCGSGNICSASSAVDVYEYDRSDPNAEIFQSICCQKGAEFKCVARAS